MEEVELVLSLLSMSRICIDLTSDRKRIAVIVIGYVSSKDTRKLRAEVLHTALNAFPYDDETGPPPLITHTERERVYQREQMRLHEEKMARLRREWDIERERWSRCSRSVKAYSCTQHARISLVEDQRLNHLRDQQRALRINDARQRQKPVKQRQQSNAQGRQMAGRSMRAMKNKK